MKDRFLNFIKEKQLFNVEDKILLAVSGGIDSVALAALFNESKFNFAMAHCNFCLRGEESDGDEEFVKGLAKKYKVPFYAEKFDTAAFAEKEKVSIQMAARYLRYAWFNKLLDQFGYKYLATAHHHNDVLETVILNFTKGSGISGFHGIREKNGKIIRPLLFAQKDDILDYIAEKQVGWREDSSNESNKYQRNLIRNEVLPLLKKINPNLEETIKQTVERVSAVENEFLAGVDELKTRSYNLSKHHTEIQIAPWLGLPPVFLAEALKDFNFSYGQSVLIYQSIEGQPGKKFVSPTHTLIKDRDIFQVVPNDLKAFGSIEIGEEAEAVELEDGKIKMELLSKNVKITNDVNVAYLDKDKLVFPLKLRKWKDGDWFIPLGMNGKKKLSDFLIDKKVSLASKPQIKVLVSGDSIVWVVGMRIDDRFKITDKTKSVYKVNYLRN